MAAACAAPQSAVARDWFAVHVWHGREQSSAHHLRHRGYEVFLPSYRQVRCWSDRVKTVERPLFPGYLFIRAEGMASGKYVTAPGVIRILSDAHGPTPVPPPDIESIRRIVEARCAVEPWPFVNVGERVRVESGPLCGAEGIVLRLKNRHHLIVSIVLLQRSVAVEIDAAWVRSVDDGL